MVKLTENKYLETVKDAFLCFFNITLQIRFVRFFFLKIVNQLKNLQSSNRIFFKVKIFPYLQSSSTKSTAPTNRTTPRQLVGCFLSQPSPETETWSPTRISARSAMTAMASVSLDETLEMSTFPWLTFVIGGLKVVAEVRIWLVVSDVVSR